MSTGLSYSCRNQHGWYHDSPLTLTVDDIENQGAAHLARHFDKAGKRTIGNKILLSMTDLKVF